MGWGRMLLLGDWGQQLDIHDTKAALTQIEHRLRQSGRFDEETSRFLESLHREHHELRLYHAALARLLVSKGVITREELALMVDQIDGADGKADRKLNGPLAP